MGIKKIIGCAVVTTICSVAANNITSHSFFSVRPEFQTGTPEREVFLRDPFIRNSNTKQVFEMVPFVGHSMNSDKIARYFLPFDKSEILVAEDNSIFASQRDVNAIHLNINHDPLTTPPGNTFASRSKFEFERTVMGIGFGYRRMLYNHDGTGCWFAVSSPFEIVRNNVVIKETVLNHGGPVEQTRVGNVTLAFKQPGWKYGRIDGNSRQKIGLADIDAQFGYAWQTNLCYADLYLGVVIPAGNEPQGRCVFEPILGNNQHGGMLYGATFARALYNSARHSLSLILSMNGRYLFPNTQTRSFDLTDKQWGRYMEVYDSIVDAEIAANATSVATGNHGEAGINVFTQKMHVHPGPSTILNMAFLYKGPLVHGEIGYQLWGRQAERVSLACCWPRGQAAPALVAAPEGGETTKSRTINHNAAGSDDVLLPGYAFLTESDLNLAAAAHPDVVDHLVYFSGGFDCNENADATEVFLDFGASYEFSTNNGSLDRWLSWFKYGCKY